MKKYLIFTVLILLLCELLLRLSGSNPYKLSYIRSFEEYFQYDPYFGWVGKPDYSLNSEFFGAMQFDGRGFPILPAIANDTIKNDKKILYIGACYTYGGPMLGPAKGFFNLLAAELHEKADFDAIGIMGYNLYQFYLLNKKYNDGTFSVIVSSITPSFDFYLNTSFYLHEFGNRLVPWPEINGAEIRHQPVPFVKSYWGPEQNISKRLTFKEKVLTNCYLLSKIISAIISKTSFNLEIPKKILKEFKKDVEDKKGKLIILVFNLLADQKDEEIDKITDDFLVWMAQNGIAFIDLRKQLKGQSFIDRGDPFHINFNGQKIIKDELIAYLKKTGVFTSP